MTKKTEILIYGMSDFAKLMRTYLDRVELQKVVAYVADQNFIKQSNSFDTLPLVPFEEVEVLYPPKSYSMLVAVGYSNMRARQFMFDKAKKKNYNLINYVSPAAIVDESVKIGENNIIFQGTVIEPNVVIKDNNIIWSSVNVSHDVEIGSHSFLASQSLIGGCTKIGNGCFLGFNSTCSQNLSIGEESLIGANALVLKDTMSFSKNIGSPSKVVGFHQKEGICVR
ncbi:acetyltransferase [Alishewanella sp. HL-SH06]|uniref:acetyltransferase n=1 Tax=Alishewanella sp. HL-SH06 TaxID=3461144 RepID=UPI00404150C3